jgi:putative peptide zinc metalloprotease protein
MSTAIEQAPSGAVKPEPRPAGGDPAVWPRLLAGTELIGQAAGSGLREAPYLVRRCDGQIVQLSGLLHEIASCMDGRDLAAIAESVSTRVDLRISPSQVAYVAEQKLFPLGLIAQRDGSAPVLERRTALLALKFRAGLVPPRVVNALAVSLQPLFWPPVVIATLAALVLGDVWLGTSHGIAAGLGTVIDTPVLGLALLAMTMLSLVFHECGHAAACRYGGARAGRIGVGIYLVWPAFFTDVTDSYRLSKTGRLRTDLGGVYFNALFALIAAATYFATGYKPLLVLVVTQQILILDQFIPWMRLDGYHIVSDLVGVSDLFARIRPVLASFLPGRRPGPRVTELKTWARAAVTIWVLTTVVALTGMAVLVVVNASGYVTRAWYSLILQIDWIGQGDRIGSVVDVMSGTIGAFMLVLPIVGFSLTFLRLCGGLGSSLAVRHARSALTLASPAAESAPPATPEEVIPAPPATLLLARRRAEGPKVGVGEPRRWSRSLPWASSTPALRTETLEAEQ